MSIAPYTISKISEILKGKLVQHQDDAIIKNLSFDSRKLTEPAETLFFAIKGKRHDGHAFLEELYARGVRNFVVSDSVKQNLPQANLLQVKDSIEALQELAAFHRSQFKIPVIGITGSNGKTIVKEWLSQLLEEDYAIVKSPKSYNSQIGVPLSVWQMNENHALGIFEAGISSPDEMENLEMVIQPNIGIFTNIGEAHTEGFLNIRHKVKEKLRLFVHSDVLIYCKDYHDITLSLSEIKGQFKNSDREMKFQLFTWSKQKDADVQIKKIEKKSNRSFIEAEYEKKSFSFSIPFIDEASIENAIHCWVTALYLKCDLQKIEQRMQKLGTIAMRMELKDAVNNCSLINDSYNSDLGSLAIALDFMNQQQQHEKKTLILSDILQSGKEERQLYKEVSELIEQKKVNRLIAIGKGLSNQKKFFRPVNGFETVYYENTDEFLKQLPFMNFQDETILLKGARQFEFERISKQLERKVHETVLEINLNALVHNLQVYHGLLKPNVKIMAMVKAFSYGSGSFEIANVLQYHRVDYLAVAYADEGVALRKAGITLPIVVMNPETKSFESIITHQLEPEIYSFSMLNNFENALSAFVKEPNRLPYPVHIKVDTGMHRLGFVEEEIPTLIKALTSFPGLKVDSVFSHLSASEDAKHDQFTNQQIDLFKKVSEEINGALGYPIMKHILNSGGITRFPEAQFDLVRLGIGLYGIDSSETMQDQLQPVSALKTTISQIKTIQPKESVGYSRNFIAEKEMKIAVVGIGYADGINRRLGNGNGKMMIKGKLVPVIGNVCMDMCMLDVTDISDANEGDEVIVFGKELPIQEVAIQAGTIPYEILTGISARVKRVYFQE